MTATGVRVREDVRRQDILDSAVVVLSERGVSGARVADVADRCGISAGLVHYYFSSRELLLLAALVHANDRFFLRLTRELRGLESPHDQLERLIDLSLPRSADDPESVDDWALWLELWVRALRDPAAAREREVLEHRFRFLIGEIIERGREKGEFGGALDPRALGVRIGMLIDGLGVQILLGDSDFLPLPARRIALETSLLIIEGSAP